MKIEMQKIDLKTNASINYVADVQKEKDEAHHIYSLLYEGYRTDWKEKQMPAVKVLFEESKYNYTTSVSYETDEKEANKYFIGTVFNVGEYPQEIMKKCIGIEYINGVL
jgi:hypothetical protein